MLTPAAVTALVTHGWSGNVRELKSAIERAVLIADGRIDVGDLGLSGSASSPTAAAVPSAASAATSPVLTDELDALEKQRIVDALAAHGGNQTRAADSLGMPRRTFVKRLAQYGIQRPRR